jgi:hypothetical protein
MTTILLLSGWAGSGKDTVADILVRKHGYHRVAFADALKRDAAVRTGLPLSDFHTAAKDKPLSSSLPAFPTAHTPRDIILQLALQMRAENPDIYADTVIHDIAEHTGDKFVVSDWRYKREEQRIREMCSEARIITARVIRSGITQSYDPSERDLDNANIDIIIENNGTLADLEKQVAAIMPCYS